MLIELLALDFRDLELEGGGLPAAVSSSERARAPGRAAVYLCEVCELAEGIRVAEGNKDDAVVGEGGDGVGDGRFLTAAWGRRAHEHTSVLLGEST